MPTDSMIEAVQQFALNEAILLDPVYSGKTAAGLIDLVRKGVFAPGSNALFLHTGCSPALYAKLDRGQEPAQLHLVTNSFQRQEKILNSFPVMGNYS